MNSDVANNKVIWGLGQKWVIVCNRLANTSYKIYRLSSTSHKIYHYCNRNCL